jgi:4-hydroxyphenylpyruvate dioxygenase-like putative hemolysin
MTADERPDSMVQHNGNRIDHVVFIVRPENLESAAERLAAVLDLTFDGPHDDAALGVRLLTDWKAGIELLTPYDPQVATTQAAYLEKHGEGFYRLVFGVTDLERAVERARTHGLEIGQPMNGLELNPRWSAEFDRIDEVPVQKPWPGFYLTLGQIEPRSTPG